MKRYIITNRITGESGALTDADLLGLPLEQWIDRNSDFYGRGERRFSRLTHNGGLSTLEMREGILVAVTPPVEDRIVTDPETGEERLIEGHPEIVRPLEEIHPEWYRIAPPVLDGNEIVVPAEYEIVVEDIGNPTLDAALAKLWKGAWEWAGQFLSLGDLAIIQGWRDEGILTQTGIDMLVDIRVWHDTIFSGPYATAKAAIEVEGDWVEPDWSSWPPAPHGFGAFQAQRTA
jgi:hypothetical protein